MESPFFFIKEVVGDRFVGRTDELTLIKSNIINGQSSVIISPPRYGKTSLVRQAFSQALKLDRNLRLCYISLFNIRTEEDFYAKLINEAFKALCDTADDWRRIAKDFFLDISPDVDINGKTGEIKLVFDSERASINQKEFLEFFRKYPEKYRKKPIVCIEDFQNIETFEDNNKRLIKQFKENSQIPFILTGSKKNGMRQLFETGKAALHRFGDILILEPVDEKLFIDYLSRAFSKSGRVIKKEQAEKLCQAVKNYPYYVQLYAHIIWNNTKGFVTDQTIELSENELLEYCRPEYLRSTEDLSNTQINYLKALIDGVDRFCSAESMINYGLNSSANVARVRSALIKKEIIEYVKHKPFFIDPVYELWFKNIFMN